MLVKNKALVAALVLGSVIINNPAHAAVLSVDDPTFGVGAITRDTSVGGLDWLDLNLTAGLSYNQVLTEIGSGGQFEGFRFATGAEIAAFFNSAGGPSSLSSYPIFISNVSGSWVELLTDMWGGGGNSFGVNTSTGEILQRFSYFIFGESENQYNHWQGYLADNALTYASWDLASIYQNGVPDVVPYSTNQSALVREVSTVPVPAAVWLFGSGLISLVGLSRRKG